MTERNYQKRSRKKRQNSSVARTAIAAVLLLAVAVFIFLFVKREEKDFIQAESITAESVQIAESSAIEIPEIEETTADELSKETITGEITVEETAPLDLGIETEKMYVVADKVNVRSEPSKEATKVGELACNSEVGAIEKGGEWTSILYNNQICYVKSEYLTGDKDWKEHLASSSGYKDGESVTLEPTWKYADYSAIYSGSATMHLAKGNRKNITIGVNAGHGTEGGSSVKTWCHPDKTPKVTGGTTAAGAEKAMAVSGGMTFSDGTLERTVTLKEAMILKELLLENGFDVLMIREDKDVQLDNVARTVICNNAADCHIAIHWDGDSLDYDKGCFYMSVPDAMKGMEPVASTWQESEALGDSLIAGLKEAGCKIFSNGAMDMDLTQTSYSTIPSVDIELGNQSSDHSEEKLYQLAQGLAEGIEQYFGK